MSITYSQIKSLIGRNVNIRLRDDSVIVNVKIKKYIREKRKSKIVIQRNKTEEIIQLDRIKEIKPVNKLMLP